MARKKAGDLPRLFCVKYEIGTYRKNPAVMKLGCSQPDPNVLAWQSYPAARTIQNLTARPAVNKSISALSNL